VALRVARSYGHDHSNWGNPEHLAFDVRLDDGRTQLFWYHELEGVAEGAY
jgi:hypothetical protein